MSIRKVRSDKKIRVAPGLNQETHRKLKRLALACDLTKTSMAEEMIQLCVNHPTIIKYFQDKFKAEEFKVVPVTDWESGTVDF